MKALSNEEFLENEGLGDDECLSCGGMLKESRRKNTNEEGIELPRFFCKICGVVYEQTDDYEGEY